MIKISTLIEKMNFWLCSAFLFLPSFAQAAEETDNNQCNSLQYFIDEALEDGHVFEALHTIYTIIKNACVDVAEHSWELFAPSLQGVVAVGTGIYIAVYTLRNIGSFSQQDTAAYFSNDKTGLFFLMAKATFIILLLANQDFVYKYLVSPIIQAGVIISGTAEEYDFEDATNVSVLFDKIIETIEDFNESAYTVVAMGRVMLCLFHLPDSIIEWYWKMLPFGALAYIFGELIILFLAFYMMDILIRLGVACMLLPFGIACGISKLTSTYTKKLWNLYINIAFNFVILGIVISFTKKMLEACILSLVEAKFKEFLAKEFLSVDDAQMIADELSLGSFILVTLCSILAIKLFTDVENIAEKVSGADGSKLGTAQKAAASMAKSAANVAKVPFQEGGKMLGAAAEQAGADIMETKPAREVRSAYRKFRQWGKNLIGIND